MLDMVSVRRLWGLAEMQASYNREACGILRLDVESGLLNVLPLPNFAIHHYRAFLMALSVEQWRGCAATWHSHLKGRAIPSGRDIQAMDRTGFPMVIISLPERMACLYRGNGRSYPCIEVHKIP